MGKVEHSRYKYHSSAPRSMDTDSIPEHTTYPQNSTLVDSYANEEQGPVQIRNNIFQNIVIPPSVLKQELLQHSYTSSLPKKEKSLKVRESFPLSVGVKQMLIEQKKVPKKSRLSVAQVSAEIVRKREEEKQTVKEKKEAVLGDWKSLKDALSETNDYKIRRRELKTRKMRNARTELQICKMRKARRELQTNEDMTNYFSALQHFEWEFDAE